MWKVSMQWVPFQIFYYFSVLRAEIIAGCWSDKKVTLELLLLHIYKKFLKTISNASVVSMFIIATANIIGLFEEYFPTKYPTPHFFLVIFKP
jgi:hypothetical protein